MEQLLIDNPEIFLSESLSALLLVDFNLEGLSLKTRNVVELRPTRHLAQTLNVKVVLA